MLHNVSDNWDRVVLKLINANPGLKVNRINFLSCMKLLFTSYLLCKLKDKQYILTENSQEKYKTEFEISAYPWLA